MRTFRTRLAWTAIPLLVAVTLGTQSIIGQSAKRQAKHTPESIHEKAKHMPSGPAAQQQGEPNPLANPRVVRSLAFPGMAAQSEGQLVAVSGHARVDDRKARQPVHLAVKGLPLSESKNKRGAILQEHHYLENAVALEAGQTRMTPTFNDVIILKPGTYHVELTIYAVPPDFQFNRVKFGEDIKKKAGAGLTRHAKVVVKD